MFRPFAFVILSPASSADEESYEILLFVQDDSLLGLISQPLRLRHEGKGRKNV